MRKNLHFRRIPDYIERELENIRSQYVVVAAIIDTTKNNVSNGEFKRFGIQTKEGEIEILDSISPDKLSGLYARYNRNGKVWVLRDLPKITKTYSWESPNFGDPEKGYHTTYIDREVYQRKLEPPRDWEIVFSIISVQADKVRIKAQISAVLDKQNVDFRKDLFFAINLLQEQFQDCHVFDSNITDEEIRRNTIVGWEIFPPGTRESTIKAILSRMRNPTPERQREMQSRLDVLERLHPTRHIYGKGMDSHYIGAMFSDNIVAFENADYGNAIYILFDNWQEISQMSRIDILKRHERDYIRVIHKKGWEKTFERYINELRDKK